MARGRGPGEVRSEVVNGAGHPFYDAAAFWPAAGIIVGLLAIAATIWVTLRAANPKRRLFYSMPVVTPLLTPRPDLPDIEVRRAGKVLANPHVVTVRLVSRGRRDIPRGALDGGEPLRLDVGAAIVEWLEVTTWPSDRPDPVWEMDGSSLRLGPRPIGERQTTPLS